MLVVSCRNKRTKSVSGWNCKCRPVGRSKNRENFLPTKNLRRRTAWREPLDRVALLAAGPNLYVGKGGRQQIGQLFDGEPLRGIVPGQDERDANGFPLQTGVKPRFATDKTIASLLARVGQHRPSAS